MVRQSVIRLLVFGALLAAPLASLAEKPVEIAFSRAELEQKWRARNQSFLDRGVIPLIDLQSSLKRGDGEAYATKLTGIWQRLEPKPPKY